MKASQKNNMKYHPSHYSGGAKNKKKKFYKKKSFLIPVIIILIILLGGAIMAFKTGYVLNKISISDESGLKSLLGAIGGKKEVKVDESGRVNVLLLGMRGTDMPGGGLLADTIILASYQTEENKLALISIPRDLYVKIPDTQRRVKINAVYAYGEEQGKDKGMEAMEQAVSEITGLPVEHAVTMNFAGFKELINAVDGIEVYLETPFYETSQFVQGQECGTHFELPQGLNELDGETALCYARARENTSDFDRSKRQQLMLKALKDKLVSVGTLTDITKLNRILDALGNNVKTDFSSSQIRNFYEKYGNIKDAQIYQRVFENSEEGFLMVPQDAPEGAGYILIPRAGWDDYSKVHEVCENIFEIPSQSDIQPVKQYTRPTSKKIKDDEKGDEKADKDDDEEDEEDEK